MMNATLVSGTGRQAALPDQIAGGKTGTSQSSRDAWFVGYTAHYAAGVWVGNDDGSKMRNVTGGTLPARLWHDLMAYAHEGKQPASLPGTHSPWLEQAASRVWGAPAEGGTSRSTAACSAFFPADRLLDTALGRAAVGGSQHPFRAVAMQARAPCFRSQVRASSWRGMVRSTSSRNAVRDSCGRGGRPHARRDSRARRAARARAARRRRAHLTSSTIPSAWSDRGRRCGQA